MRLQAPTPEPRTESTEATEVEFVSCSVFEMAEKIKIVAVDDGVEIIANREGLKGLADL